MESGDGWLARIRPQRGRLPSALLRKVADAALRHGNGILEITNRGNLQVRGLRPESIAPFTTAMEEAGAAAGEGSRILISPLSGADPSLAPDLLALADEIDRALPEGLSAKFGVLLDGGGALPLSGIVLDLVIRWTGADWAVNGKAVARDAIATHIRESTMGLARVSERAGHPPKLGRHAGFLLLAPAFGQMRAEALLTLADLAETHGDGALRPTPWKSIALAGVAWDQAPTVLQAAEKRGFITDPNDGRLSLITCAGAPACARGEIATHDAASALAASRRAGDGLLHLSGCVKGCAHPGAAPVTLVGRAGKIDLVRHGKAADTPAFRGLSLAEIPATMQSLPA
jgi:precorrin-3B synthase